MVEIEEYIARDNPAAGEAHIDLLFQRVEALTSFAHRGRRLPERPNDDLREIIVKGYRIIYRVREPDVLEVITVQEGHRLLRDDELDR